jgi:inorganic pyrophosphatase
VLSKQRGGDGDPLDVLVLGPAAARGALVPVRVIGVMRMVDRGEVDDKLLAVAAGSPFAGVQDAAQLEREFPGVREIVTTWFSHYKGPGKTQARGFDGREPALALLEQALADYAAERGAPR